MVDYNKRLVEVDAILDRLTSADYKKIPEEIIKFIKQNKDKKYVWKYDETKELKDQDLSRDTIAFLSYINMEYLLNKKQKEYMQKLHELNERKAEEGKEKKYSEEDLFKNNKPKKEKTEEIEQKSLVVYKESLLKRMINKIKKFFNKK